MRSKQDIMKQLMVISENICDGTLSWDFIRMELVKQETLLWVLNEQK